jgi:hypothetical protein
MHATEMTVEPMRLLYIDPSLRQELGHHFNVCMNVVREMRRLGVHVEVHTNRAFPPSDLPVSRTFKEEIYGTLKLDPEDRSARRRLASRSYQYCEELLHAIGDGRWDTIYVHSTNSAFMVAVATVVDDLCSGGPLPSICFETPFTPEKSNSFYGAQLKLAVELLKREYPQIVPNIKFLVYEPTHKQKLEELLDCKVELLPSPYTVARAGINELKEPAVLRIGCPGHQSSKKGYHLLPAPLQGRRTISARRSDAHVL